jgi:hypothetical protein
MFERWVLRKTLEPKRDEVIDGWRQLCNDELPMLHSSQTIIRVIEKRRMK